MPGSCYLPLAERKVAARGARACSPAQAAGWAAWETGARVQAVDEGAERGEDMRWQRRRRGGRESKPTERMGAQAGNGQVVLLIFGSPSAARAPA